ncbi:MAG: hypothetical protein GX455_11660 [Phycisphaerae bacterium]|nr:hypothetical protein [Phycisphaerae bacterium]
MTTNFWGVEPHPPMNSAAGHPTPYFGRIMGNGGDWFELVVISDHLDMRLWMFDIYQDGILDETLQLTNNSIWSDLRSGTIITVSEDLASDISYNPAAGDWWIHVRAHNEANGRYIEASSFPVSSTNWQLRIRNANGTVVFGPAGEGVSPASGISNTEVFKLEANPSSATTANSPDYDGDKELSTFGAPNQWGLQSLSALRTITAAPSSLTLIAPNGSEVMESGSSYDIAWASTGDPASVRIEFSIDSGMNWFEVFPPNIGNTGTYSWLVPMLNSDICLVRISNNADRLVYDTSDSYFSIYECGVAGDLTKDCIVDLHDFAILAASWLDCGNPYVAECLK